MITDKDRIDWLEEQLQKSAYTGRTIFRQSTTGRGWRLHETSHEGSSATVREAIDKAMLAGSPEAIKEITS